MNRIWATASDKSMWEMDNHSFLCSKRQLSVRIATFLNVDEPVHSNTSFLPGSLCKLYSCNASLGYSGASSWCLIQVLPVMGDSSVHSQ